MESLADNKRKKKETDFEYRLKYSFEVKKEWQDIVDKYNNDLEHLYCTYCRMHNLPTFVEIIAYFKVIEYYFSKEYMGTTSSPQHDIMVKIFKNDDNNYPSCLDDCFWPAEETRRAEMMDNFVCYWSQEKFLLCDACRAKKEQWISSQQENLSKEEQAVLFRYKDDCDDNVLDSFTEYLVSHMHIIATWFCDQFANMVFKLCENSGSKCYCFELVLSLFIFYVHVTCNICNKEEENFNSANKMRNCFCYATWDPEFLNFLCEKCCLIRQDEQ